MGFSDDCDFRPGRIEFNLDEARGGCIKQRSDTVAAVGTYIRNAHLQSPVHDVIAGHCDTEIRDLSSGLEVVKASAADLECAHVMAGIRNLVAIVIARPDQERIGETVAIAHGPGPAGSGEFR